MRQEFLTDRDDIFVVHDFLSVAECDAFIAQSEAAGFRDAPVNQAFGSVVRKEMRSNDRVMIDDVPLAEELWQRAKPFVPQNRGQWKAAGLNERFRFYRYQPTQLFDWHFDGCFERSPLEQSSLTFLIYLNDGFEGGATLFNLFVGRLSESDPIVHVTPRRGTLLIFVHNVLHKGDVVKAGTKYVLRSDVMYRWQGNPA